MVAHPSSATIGGALGPDAISRIWIAIDSGSGPVSTITASGRICSRIVRRLEILGSEIT